MMKTRIQSFIAKYGNKDLMSDKNTKPWALYHQSRPDKIENIQRYYPIVYLPWGALEYHSYHNPVGLDSIKAYNLCIDLAKACGGLVLPPIYQAANLIKSYPGVDFKKHSIEFSESLILQTCVEYFHQLIDAGFKVIVCLSGHAGEPHLNILRQVSQDFALLYPSHRFWTLAEFDILPIHMLEANHSALGETSLQLFYDPESVDLSLLPQDRPTSLIEDGISGLDPRHANAGLGSEIAHLFITNASKIINILLDEAMSKNPS